MSNHNYHTFLFVIAIIFALLAGFAGMIWIYYVALFVGLPCALVAFFIWRSIKKDGKKRNRLIPILLGIAVLCSLGTLIYWLTNLYTVDCS